MNILGWVVVITTIAGVGGTGLGGLVGAVIHRNSEKIVSLLLSFAGGVMLSIVCFDLLQNALHPENTAVQMPFYVIVLGILVGYAVVYGLNYWIDKNTNHEIKHVSSNHPKTADDLDELIHADHFEEHRKMNSTYQLFIGGIVMACAIALHNLPEGMVIGASFAGVSSAAVFSGSGLALAVVIGLHNIPEGMAVSVPLVSGGMNRWKAVLTTALTGAPTIIGAIIGYLIGMISPLALTLALSFASGAMLYVVFGELLPEAILMWRSKAPALLAVVGIIVGMLISQ